MVTMTVGMRELARNSKILDGYDYVDVEDKKTHKPKGLFVSPNFYINSDKKKILNFFNIIYKRWIILPFSKQVIKEAIEISLEKNLDLEDTLQYLCAKENNCQALITNDKNFSDYGIEVYTPEEFLRCQD